MKYLMILVGVVCLTLVQCGGDSSTSPTPAPPPPPPPQAASWLLTFANAEVGVESFFPPRIFVEPKLRLQETNGAPYRVNSIAIELRILERPDYLQQDRMNAAEISSAFGTNEFSGGGTEVFEPHFVVKLFPDGTLLIDIVVAVADDAGNSKKLRVSQVGDTASIKAFLRNLNK